MEIAYFTFNDFAENTYVLYDDSRSCVIIDPGCNNSNERSQLTSFIETNKLTPAYVINTHCHIDHVLGNRYITETYDIPLYAHEGEVPVLASCEMVAQMYGIPYDPSPTIDHFIKQGEALSFGNTSLEVFYTPGHSPASVSLYHKNTATLIAGDVLFRQSIGRTDLPGGDFNTLIQSIKSQLFILPDETVVYPGHGPETTIGYEKQFNPFMQ